MKQRVGAQVGFALALAVILIAAGCGPALSARNGTVDTKLAADIEVVDATITNLQLAFGDAVPVTQTQVNQLLADAQRARDSLMSVGSRLAVDDHVRGTSADLIDAVN